MPFSRQDRINLRKQQLGSPFEEPTINDLDEGIPTVRTIVDHESGQYKTVQYIKNGLNLVKSEFKNTDAEVSSYEAKWVISDEIDIDTSHETTTQAILMPDNSYLMDIRILVTSAITAGSMDIDVGIGTNVDMFIDGWNGDTGSTRLDTINAFGRGSGATETGVKVGKFFSDADSVDILVTTGATTGKVRLMALILKSPVVASMYT